MGCDLFSKKWVCNSGAVGKTPSDERLAGDDFVDEWLRVLASAVLSQWLLRAKITACLSIRTLDPKPTLQKQETVTAILKM